MTTIRSLNLQDLPQAAQVHLKAFPKSALTLLGAESVRRYYEWQIVGPHDCLALGAFGESGRLVGFCFGGIFRGALSGFLARNKKYLALQVIQRPWLVFTNTLFRDRLSQGLRIVRKRNGPEKPTETTPGKVFGILSIAVDPACQQMGIGRQLMEYSETYAKAHGFASMRLTVAPENLHAIQFYETNNWKKQSAAADWNGLMVKDLR